MNGYQKTNTFNDQPECVRETQLPETMMIAPPKKITSSIRFENDTLLDTSEAYRGPLFLKGDVLSIALVNVLVELPTKSGETTHWINRCVLRSAGTFDFRKDPTIVRLKNLEFDRVIVGGLDIVNGNDWFEIDFRSSQLYLFLFEDDEISSIQPEKFVSENDAIRFLQEVDLSKEAWQDFLMSSI